jgi:hypothetical protein
MCVGSGSDDKDKKGKKDKKVTTNDQGAGTAIMGLLDGVTAAKTGDKVDKKSPARDMTYGKSPVGRNSNLPSGTILAMDNSGGKKKDKGTGFNDEVAASAPMAASGDFPVGAWTQPGIDLASSGLAPGTEGFPIGPWTEPGLALNPVPGAPTVVETPSTLAPVATAAPRTSTTYGPLGSAFSQMDPRLAKGGGSGQVYR